MKIMTVDDEPDIRFMVRRILEKAGYEVIEARNGEECLEKLKKEKPDLILLDVMMPGLNGWETLKKIRAKEEWKSIPIAMVTVKSLLPELQSRNMGIEELVDYVEKPFTRETLLNRVTAIFDAVAEIEQMKKKLEGIRKTQLKAMVEEYETQTKASLLHRNIRITLQETLEQKVFKDIELENVVKNESTLLQLYENRKKELEQLVKAQA